MYPTVYQAPLPAPILIPDIFGNMRKYTNARGQILRIGMYFLITFFWWWFMFTVIDGVILYVFVKSV